MTTTGDREKEQATRRAGDGSAAVESESNRWVTARTHRGRYRTTTESRTHFWIQDEPVSLGGTDLGPTPYETMLGALGGCTAITLRMYADRKGWPLESVSVRLRQSQAHEVDCENCETDEVGPHRLEREIDLEGPLTDEQRSQLLRIADRCPVKQTLERGIAVVPSRSDS